MRCRFMLAVWILSACSPEVVAQPPAPPVNWNPSSALAVQDGGPLMATAKERAAAGAYSKALSSPGFAALGPLLDDEAHVAFASARDAHGREQVVKTHETLFGAFDPREFVATRVLRTDNSQVLEWTLTGVQAKEWMGAPATNKSVTIKGVTLLWTKDDGSITDVHVYFDEAVVKGQLGLGPKELQRPAQPPGSRRAWVDIDRASSPEENANVVVVRAWLDALERNNEKAYVATVTEGVEVNSLEGTEPALGKESVRAYYKAMHKAIGDLDTSIENVWGVRTYVAVEYSIVGAQVGPIGWIAPHGDGVIKMRVVDVLEMWGGSIARVWHYDNPSEILSGR